MKGFFGLTKRNLLLFFKDKQAVFFSLLTSVIVLVLNLLFLKDTFVSGMNSVLAYYEGLDTLISQDDVNMFANLTLLTGILGSAMITVPYNCLSTLVRDRENKVDYDILATPIKRGQIILSYFISAAVSSILLTSVILAAGLLILTTQGSIYLGAWDVLATFGIVALGSVSATAFFLILMLLFKSSSASGAFFGMLSAAAGFVIGAYIPISQFADSVQTLCNLFPASQVTILLRNRLLGGLLAHMDLAIGGVDEGMFVESVKDIFTFSAHLFGGNLEVEQMLVYVTLGIFLCIAIQVLVYTKTYKKN